MNDALKKLIRPHYLMSEGYSSAGMEAGKADDIAYMNANENPFPLPALTGMERYPEPQPQSLAEAYAHAYGLGSPDQILMTRGADEAITLLTRVFCEPGEDSITIHPPTFGVYKAYSDGMPVAVNTVPLLQENGTFHLDEEGLIAAAARSKLLFICNPNNPSGTEFPHEQIRRIIRAVEGKAAVVVDETYAEMSAQGSLAAKLSDYPNLIMLRTLSKSYGLAGMRMGSALCHDKDFIALMRTKVMETYPLPRESIKAAMIALDPDNAEQVKENIIKMLTERDRIREMFQMSRLVNHIYPSSANFLLIEMERASEFVAYCAQHKMILRDFSTKPMTENCIRISPGTPEQNDKLFTLLRSFEAQGQ